MKLMIGAATVLATAAAFGCVGSSHSARSTYHPAFRAGFKESFMRSCERNSASQAQKAYCSCSEGKLEKRFSDSELTTLASQGALGSQRPEVQAIFNACRLEILKR